MTATRGRKGAEAPVSDAKGYETLAAGLRRASQEGVAESQREAPGVETELRRATSSCEEEEERRRAAQWRSSAVLTVRWTFGTAARHAAAYVGTSQLASPAARSESRHELKHLARPLCGSSPARV